MVGFGKTAEGTAIYCEDITVTYQIAKDKPGWSSANSEKCEDERITPLLVESVIKANCKKLSDTEAANRSKIELLSIQNLQASLDGDYRKKDVSILDVVIGKSGFDKESLVCLEIAKK